MLLWCRRVADFPALIFPALDPATDDHGIALDLDVAAPKRDHLAAPHSGGEIEEQQRVVAFAGQTAVVGLLPDDLERRSRFVIGARLRNLLLFELREEDDINNVVTKYRSKEIKLAFRDSDEFRRSPKNPGGIEMNKPTTHRRLPFLIAAGLCLLAGLALAQRSPKKHNQPSEQPPVYDAPKNQEDLSGRFTFARIRFDVGAHWAGMPLGDNGPPWSHDYPDAGRHLMQIMAELSKLDVTLGRNEVIYAFGDPELFKYPFAYLCEVGYMRLTDKELAGMREYCLRGGFLLVDDFRLDDWYVFAAQIKEAFPEYELKELDLSQPIFNCFFSIKTLDVQPPYGGWTPKFYGLEDSAGRLMMIVNYNNDVSDYWQWSGNPFYPIDTTNEAYKFGVNYIIYALTH